jgi:hypothetical protein
MGDALPCVDLGTGRTARALASGWSSTCAILDNNRIKCWGSNLMGQLGLGDGDNRGDGPGEMGDALPYVDLGQGRTVTAIAVSAFFSCATLDGGALKCWGANQFGQLGLGDARARGGAPGEMGDALPAVDLGAGRRALGISTMYVSTCVLLDNARVRCWGDGLAGQHGSGLALILGDRPGETGDALPYADLGGY